MPAATIAPPTTAPPDRRHSPRAAVDILANRFLDGYPYICRTVDISREGMRVYRLHEPAAATRFMGLQFQLPGSADILSAAGEVVFSNDSARAVGLRFTKLPAATESAITAFVSAACACATSGSAAVVAGAAPARRSR